MATDIYFRCLFKIDNLQLKTSLLPNEYVHVRYKIKPPNTVLFVLYDGIDSCIR